MDEFRKSVGTGKLSGNFNSPAPIIRCITTFEGCPTGISSVWPGSETAQEAIDAGRDPRLQGNSVLHPDFIIEVKPDKVHNGGEIVWEWHAWDHLIQDFDKTKANYGDVAAHPELIDFNFPGGGGGSGNAQSASNPPSAAPVGGGFPGAGGFGPGGPRGFGGFGGGAGNGGTVPPDWLHTNSIAYNARFDQIMISCYGLSEILIIDHSTTTKEAKAHTGGKHGKGGDLLYRWGNPRAYRAVREGPDIIQPAQCGLDSRRLAGCRTYHGFR